MFMTGFFFAKISQLLAQTCRLSFVIEAREQQSFLFVSLPAKSIGSMNWEGRLLSGSLQFMIRVVVLIVFLPEVIHLGELCVKLLLAWVICEGVFEVWSMWNNFWFGCFLECFEGASSADFADSEMVAAW
jgi:hypothetical protein